ncbi:AzlC family ABC transporter permease [Dongia sp.]|uniref:AzlC family ABC transporter permease n=1 Tax=Dongia sp. TaxID=1977262 RepID=UPI0035B0C93C
MTDIAKTDRSMAGAEFMRGLAATFPLMVSAIPFGIIFGTLATNAGLSPLAVMGMSLFVFSGSAQFIAILLLGTGSALGVIWLATLILNLRHLLYAATLVDHVRHLNQTWRFGLSALLTDETFAVMERRYREEGGGPNAHWYYFASCLGMYLNWQFWTFIGIVLGTEFPAVRNWGLEFAMIVTFTGIVMPALRSSPFVLAAIVAGTVATLGNALPYKLGLMLGALAGILAGLVAQEWRRRRSRGERVLS